MLLVLLQRFLGRGKERSSAPDAADQLERQVMLAQTGDQHITNELITNYQPYIAKVTSRFCRKYIDPSHDDEFSIALDAFHEAIHKYSSTGGQSFLGFAETVIRRRLIDYVRKEQKFQRQIPYSSFEVEDDEEQTINPIEIRQALDRHDEEREAESLRHEIVEYSRVLAEFDIAFAELVDLSPKHADSRRLLTGIARRLADNGDWMNDLYERRQLPIKQLLTRIDYSRKTVERNRKYIIAVALIYAGPFPYLQNYLIPEDEPYERSESHA